MGDEVLLSTTEAGERLGLSSREVYGLIDRRELAGVRGDDGRIRVRAVDVQRRLEPS